jgi:ABC-type sugar transport system permease subunit
VFWVILQTIGVFLWIFGWIYVLTQGGPGYASTTIDYDIYSNAFLLGKWGYAAAEAVFLVGIVATLYLVGRLVSRGRRS